MFNVPDVTKFKELFTYLGYTLTSGGVILIILTYLVLFHLDKLEYFGSKVLSLFQWVGVGVRKTVISKDIRARILQASMEVSKEIDGVLPYDLKIKWVKDVDRDTFVNGGQVIIRMDSGKSKTRNIVYALNQYVSKGLLPKTRNYIDINVIKSSDLYMVRKLLLLCYDQGIDYFDDAYMNPIMNGSDDIKELIRIILSLDDSELFVQVLLREFIEKSQRLYPSIPDPSLVTESREFLRFLHRIATKSSGEDVELVMDGIHFKVGGNYCRY